MRDREYGRYRREQARAQRRAHDSCVLVIAAWVALAVLAAAAIRGLA